MSKIKVFFVTLLLTIYESLLVIFASSNFTLNRNWFMVYDNMPVFQSNIEFLIALGQLPVITYFGWLFYRRQKAIEKDFLDKYGKNRKKK